MKSLRGDPDAALHYLARLLEAGDLPGACRRILCSASEDIGMAYPQAVSIVKACVDNALQLGLPEAQLPLAQACIPARHGAEIEQRRRRDRRGHAPTCAPGKTTSARMQMSTLTARALSASRGTNTRIIIPATGCGSSICRLAQKRALLRIWRQQDRAGGKGLLGADQEIKALRARGVGAALPQNPSVKTSVLPPPIRRQAGFRQRTWLP